MHNPRVLVYRVFQAISLSIALLVPGSAGADTDPFAAGWLLQPEEGWFHFQTVKQTAKGDIVLELSSFATVVGAIGEDGAATLKVFLDSVDTKVDLRNVRMRFLLLETFKFPQAVASVQLDPAALASLPTRRRMAMTLPYKLELHGVQNEGSAQVSVTLISDDAVAISSVSPIPVVMADYGLSEGIAKLQEAVGAKIVPTGWISFELVFRRVGSSGANAPDVSGTTTVDVPTDTTGNLTAEACVTRFDTLSRSGNINFNSGSARLDVAGSAVLNDLSDIVKHCPDMKIEIGGHTDSDGDETLNLILSERRAEAVINYLVGQGVSSERFVMHGYGEALPIVPNDSPQNMRRNRRIEFKVLGN